MGHAGTQISLPPHDRSGTDERSHAPRWRWIGLLAALVVYAAAVLTFGFAFVLAPASLALSVLALRRVPRPRGMLPWIGVAANVALLIPLVIWVLPSLLLGA